MSNPALDRPSLVYDAIVATIVAALEAGEGAGVPVAGYEDWGPTSSEEKQVLIEFGESTPGPLQNDGRDAWYLNVVIYAVVSKGVKRSALGACNLSVNLARLVKNNRWGLSNKVIDEPEKIEESPSFFREKSGDYLGCEAREVRFSQLIKYGSDQWPEDPGQDGVIALAINPVDPDDDSAYKILVRE